MELQQFNTYKILQHHKLIKDISEGKNPFPVSCEIDPSNLCNHSCQWCYFSNSRNEKNINLDKGLLFKLIDELAAGKTRSITFTGGGEPLVNPATVEAILRAHKKGIRVGLVTNGGLLNHYKNRVIVSCCDFVRVSLDAADTESHLRLHHPHNPKNDNFETILGNLRDMAALRKKLKKNITIGVGFLAHKENYKKLPRLALRLKEIGVDYLQIRPIVLPGNESAAKAWVSASLAIKKAVSLGGKKFCVFPIEYRYQEIINPKRNYQRCLIHNLLAIVGADASVYLCSLFRGDKRFAIGNLRKHSFGMIWNSQKRAQAIKALDITKCPACRYNRYNEILEYMANKDKPHADFL